MQCSRLRGCKGRSKRRSKSVKEYYDQEETGWKGKRKKCETAKLSSLIISPQRHFQARPLSAACPRPLEARLLSAGQPKECVRRVAGGQRRCTIGWRRGLSPRTGSEAVGGRPASGPLCGTEYSAGCRLLQAVTGHYRSLQAAYRPLQAAYRPPTVHTWAGGTVAGWRSQRLGGLQRGL